MQRSVVVAKVTATHLPPFPDGPSRFVTWVGTLQELGQDARSIRPQNVPEQGGRQLADARDPV